MNSLDMIKFRRRFGLNQREAARELGCSSRAIYNYERGLTLIPKSIAMAASAYAFELPPYGEVKPFQHNHK